ncbi:MAG TPA: hypothetical protein VMD30_05015, partial [Tepidisphaeraceae bacterium]|nr:hypothetical protein [Tepidisphaeraceae bacterium]
WILIDVLTGTLIVAALMVIVSIALYRQREVLGRLDDSRAAAQDAEAGLLAMESGHKPALPGDCQWTLSPLPDAAPNANVRWICVRATVGRSTSSVAGLVDAAEVRP